MKNKIKLLILVKHIDGGTGTFVSELLNLQKINQNLIIEIAILGKQKYRQLHNKNVHIRYFKEINDYPEYYKFTLVAVFLVLKELLWSKKEIKIIQPDIIFSIDTHCNLLASILKKFFFKEIKLIISSHNNITAVTERKLSLFLCFLLKKMGNFFFKNADRIIVISNGIAKDFYSFFSIKKTIEVIPYGIDIHKTQVLSNKALSKHDQVLFDNNYLKVISICRFELQKDLDTLIKAFALVLKKRKKTRLILIGNGYDKQKLIELTKKLNLKNAVNYLGWKNNVFPFLKQSDLFVLSSKYEGFGWVILEAMSQGLPVISTNAPFGPAEVLGNGEYGVLVPVGDEQIMAKIMLRLLTDTKKRQYYALKSLTRVMFYSEEKMLQKYENLITSLL